MNQTRNYTGPVTPNDSMYSSGNMNSAPWPETPQILTLRPENSEDDESESQMPENSEDDESE